MPVIFNVYPNRNNAETMGIVLDKYGFNKKQNHIGDYYVKEVDVGEVLALKSALNALKYNFRSYDSKYERSGNYRSTYFKFNKAPYRCAYCGRRLKRENLEVDHLVPVAKAKSNMLVKFYLALCGIPNINDKRNLVSSCMRCNRRKSDKIGTWVLRGSIGRHKSIWYIRDGVMLCAGLSLLIYALSNWDTIVSFVDTVSQKLPF